MLSHFHRDGRTTLKARLGEDRHERIDNNEQTKFFYGVTRNLFNMDRISEAELRLYDLNIVVPIGVRLCINNTLWLLSRGTVV